ncbi:ATP-binding protein [Guggenheimella bovis]
MKIQSIRLHPFGKFEDQTFHFDTHKLNLVVGTNEAGKSTLFEALKTAIAGFSPANRNQFGYIPWEGSEASVTLTLEKEGVVTRTLQSSVKGSWIKEEEAEKIQNRPLYDIERVLLEELYTIHAEDLLSVSEKSFDKVFDELSTTLNLDLLRSPREAIKEANDQRKALYANNAHSTKPINLLTKSIEEKKEALERYREKEGEYREKKRLSSELERGISELRESLIEKKENLSKLQEEKECFEDWKKAEEVKKEIKHPELMTNETEEKYKELEEQRLRLVQVKEDLKVTLEKKESLKNASSLSEAEREELKRGDKVLRELESFEKDLLKKEEAIRSIDEKLAEQKLSFETIAKEELTEVPEMESYNWTPPKKNEMELPLAPSLLSFGLALAFWFLVFLNIPYMRIPAILLTGFGILWLVAMIYFQSRYVVYLKKNHLKSTYQTSKLHELYAIREQHRLLSKKRSEEIGLREEMKAYLKSMYAHYRTDNSESYSQTLEALKGKELEAIESASMSEALDDQLNILSAREESLTHSIDALETVFQVYENGSLGYKKDRENATYYEQFVKSLKPAPETDPEEELVKTDSLIKELQSKLESDLFQKATFDEQLKSFESEEVYAETESKWKLLKEERNDLVTRYNVLGLLGSLIDDQYRSYLKKHQPTILIRASELLKRFSAGHYERMLSMDDGLYLTKSDFSLQKLTDTHSKGTLNQIYLALRIAIIEELEGENKNPIFFDEAFVNWDSERLKETYDLLSDVSKERQIFFFSCNEELRKAFPETDVHVVEMSRS